MPFKVCAVTGTRADWGLLAPVLQALRADPAFDLQIIVTGQHLMETAGHTARYIADEGFTATLAIDMDLVGDSPAAVTASLGTGIKAFGAAYERLRPDLLLILGDRYEILGAVIAAALARIPVAHIAGGDLTEGAMDDAFRHAITKMSHLHFATSADAGRRLRQMGEDPEHIFVVGSPGLDRIRTAALPERAAFFQAVGLRAYPRNVMITFHPETLAADSEADCSEMLAALDRLGPDVGLLFSGVNADVGRLAIGDLVDSFVKAHANAVIHPSLGSTLYFAALKYADAVVGNSSSGVYEAPSFGTPTVNIGDRQKGRIRAASVIDVKPRRDDIHRAIMRAFAMSRENVENPYGDGHAAERIVAHLNTFADLKDIVKKKFFDRPDP